MKRLIGFGIAGVLAIGVGVMTLPSLLNHPTGRDYDKEIAKIKEWGMKDSGRGFYSKGDKEGNYTVIYTTQFCKKVTIDIRHTWAMYRPFNSPDGEKPYYYDETWNVRRGTKLWYIQRNSWSAEFMDYTPYITCEQ